MGIVNVYKGLYSEREIYNFNGRIKKNINLDWKHCKIILDGREITPNYRVKEDDVILIVEYPGAATTLAVTAIVVAVVSIGVGIGSALYARHLAREAERQMEDALRRLRNDNRRRDVESIPHLSGGRNEFAEGKQAPIILGRHLFTPYFLSEPYLRPDGHDGIDLYWYGTLLVGQRGLSLEKIRNGMIDLVSFTGDAETLSGRYEFISVSGDPNNPTHQEQHEAATLYRCGRPPFISLLSRRSAGVYKGDTPYHAARRGLPQPQRFDSGKDKAVFSQRIIHVRPCGGKEYSPGAC